MRRYIGLTLVPLGCLLSAASPALADSIGINVLSAAYQTDLATRIYTTDPSTSPSTPIETIASTVTTSSTALTSELQSSTRVVATGSADLFSVYAATNAYYDLTRNEVSAYADATSETILTFAPTVGSLAELTVSILTRDQSYFSDGAVSLFDLTTNELLWALNWDWGFVGTVPFVCCTDATVTETQSLSSDHLYELILRTSTAANTDSQSSRIAIDGLYAVPEPSSLAAMLTAFVMMGAILCRRFRAIAYGVPLGRVHCCR